MPKRKAVDILRRNDAETERDCEFKTGDELIQMLNGLSSCDFRRRYIKDEHLRFPTAESIQPGDILFEFKLSSEMTKDDLRACYDLIEHTSRADYENSGWGWNPRRKRREMKEDEMRYLLVHSDRRQYHPSDGSNIQGFLSFMLTHDSSPSVPVLYVYEIHLMPQFRRLGLGARLMRAAEDIARVAGMEKVMLTCFVCNKKANGFYERRGYRKDVISPGDRRTRNKVVKADYAILSRSVESEAQLGR